MKKSPTNRANGLLGNTLKNETMSDLEYMHELPGKTRKCLRQSKTSQVLIHPHPMTSKLLTEEKSIKMHNCDLEKK